MKSYVYSPSGVVLSIMIIYTLQSNLKLNVDELNNNLFGNIIYDIIYKVLKRLVSMVIEKKGNDMYHKRIIEIIILVSCILNIVLCLINNYYINLISFLFDSIVWGLTWPLAIQYLGFFTKFNFAFFCYYFCNVNSFFFGWFTKILTKVNKKYASFPTTVLIIIMCLFIKQFTPQKIVVERIYLPLHKPEKHIHSGRKNYFSIHVIWLFIKDTMDKTMEHMTPIVLLLCMAYIVMMNGYNFFIDFLDDWWKETPYAISCLSANIIISFFNIIGGVIGVLAFNKIIKNLMLHFATMFFFMGLFSTLFYFFLEISFMLVILIGTIMGVISSFFWLYITKITGTYISEISTLLYLASLLSAVIFKQCYIYITNNADTKINIIIISFLSISFFMVSIASLISYLKKNTLKNQIVI